MSDGKINTLPRTIKFRIWNNKTRSWVHGPHDNPSLDGVNLFGETIMFGELLHGVSLEDYNECIPLQYTGLKDSKGKQIFEGDIVNVNDRNRLIEWRGAGFYCTWSDYALDSCWFRGCGPVVVGNAFENPELIQS